MIPLQRAKVHMILEELEKARRSIEIAVGSLRYGDQENPHFRFGICVYTYMHVFFFFF